MKQPICVNIERALLEKIDNQRGDIPRSRVVEKCLNEKYCDQKPNVGSE
jgi:hypothetical protein